MLVNVLGWNLSFCLFAWDAAAAAVAFMPIKDVIGDDDDGEEEEETHHQQPPGLLIFFSTSTILRGYICLPPAFLFFSLSPPPPNYKGGCKAQSLPFPFHKAKQHTTKPRQGDFPP